MLYLVCLTVITTALIFERYRLIRARESITLRIHVHGTRGKTSCVRMIAKNLREAGFTVLAKTTGDCPEVIYPDGTTKPFIRRGPARITEHIQLIFLAKRLGANALVLEGMALQPETISFSEKMIAATHFVIVNVRPDHEETMGEGYDGVSMTLSEGLPSKGMLYVSDERTELLQNLAKERGVSFRVVKSDKLNQSATLANALVNDILSQSEEQKDSSFLPATPVAPCRLSFNGIAICFYDFLSANDVVSSELLTEAYCTQIDNSLRVALLSTRADRPLRTLCFLRNLAQSKNFDVICFAGDHAGFALLYARITQSFKSRVVFSESSPERLMHTLTSLLKGKESSSLRIVGLGNTHGFGEKWRNYVNKIQGVHYAH